MKVINYFLLPVLLLISCSEKETMDHSVRRLDITFADARSRSIWNDLSDTQDNKVSYVWDNVNTNMLTTIRRKTSGQYVPFYEEITSPPQYYSMTRFETVDDQASKIKLNTLQGVRYDVEGTNYIYPVAADDAMYCMHPLNENTDISQSTTDVHVDMHLPHTFNYSQLTNNLSSLADYSYVYTSTTLASVNDNKVIAHPSHFESACAIIRFNVTNKTTSPIQISEIKLESDDNTALFPHVIRWAGGNIAEQADKSSYYSRLTTAIGSAETPVSMPVDAKGVFYNLCFPLDGDFNHVPLKFTIETNYLTYQLKLNSDVITGHKFEAGKIYTFNFSLEEKEIRLNTIDISQCTTYNVDKTESFTVIVNPDIVWDQTGSVSAQMMFVSLGIQTKIDGEDYEVLWATSNLGAKEPIETGRYYAWGELNQKADSQYSPSSYASSAKGEINRTEYDVVKKYMGDGYWLWCMPTRDMWKSIMDSCEWKWLPVKKKVDNVETDEIDFDASVWVVTKLEAGNNVKGRIYLPITGYKGLNENTGKYGFIKTPPRCCYWTSTSNSLVEGGEEMSWAFVTSYQMDSHGNGFMQHAEDLQLCARYNGYAIRPVLLKKIEK